MSSAQTNAANWWENDPIVQPAQPQPAGGNWWENDPIVVPAQAQGPSVVTDVAKAIPSGLARGTADLVGLPGTLGDLGRSAVNWGLSRGYEAVTGSPAPEGSFFSDVKMPDSVLSGASLRRGASKLSDGATDYQPQTIPGQYAGTVAEFAPGMVLGMGSAGQRVAQVVVPALASETAGQITKGSPSEPYWRAGTAILAGLGTAAWQTPKNAQSVLSDNVSGIAEADWNAARALQARGAEQGVNLTLGEALNQVTGGRAHNISRLERVVANSGDDAGQIMNDLYAARPGQVERAARSSFDDFGPAAANPHTIGPQTGQAAEGIVNDARTAINQTTRPLYQAAEATTIDPALFQQIKDIPAFKQGLAALRSDPILGPEFARSADNSVAVVDAVQKRIKDMAAKAGSEQEHFRSSIIGGQRGKVLEAADAAAPTYAQARQAQAQLRQEQLEPLMAGPIGKIAKRDATTQHAIDALFPKDPLPGGSQQTFEAIQALSTRYPPVANQLVRTYLEQTFNRTAKELTGGPNVNGGARFVTELMGNSEKAANMRAAIRGLKNGDDILPGFERLMETLEATRWRPAPGSPTAFNQQVQKELAGGAGKASTVVEHITTGGLRLPKAIGEKWTDWRAGRNTEALARILTDPKAVPAFKALASATPGSAKAAALAARLTYFAEQGLKNGNGNR